MARGMECSIGQLALALAFVSALALEARAAQPGAGRAQLPQADVAIAEKICNAAIRGYSIDAPMDHLLPAHGVYVEGYGVVLITDVNLVALPSLYGFAGGVTEKDKTQIHDSKVKRFPAVRELFVRVAVDMASGLDRLPPEESVLLRVNFYNFEFEKKNDLPKRLTISGRKKDLVDALRPGSLPGALDSILKVTVE
jgi:hypothetical protein